MRSTIARGSMIVVIALALPLKAIAADSPQDVVRRYYNMLSKGKNVAPLLTSKSRESCSQPWDREMELEAAAMARVEAKYYKYNIKSAKVDGDRAWVSVSIETDAPIQAHLARTEAEITAKNAYNRRMGDYEAIKLNNEYLQQMKDQLQSPIGKAMAEAFKTMEFRVLCLREGRKWKVAPVEQADIMLAAWGKIFEKVTQADRD